MKRLYSVLCFPGQEARHEVVYFAHVRWDGVQSSTMDTIPADMRKLYDFVSRLLHSTTATCNSMQVLVVVL